MAPRKKSEPAPATHQALPIAKSPIAYKDLVGRVLDFGIDKSYPPTYHKFRLAGFDPVASTISLEDAEGATLILDFTRVICRVSPAKADAPKSVAGCKAKHPKTGVRCVLPAGHEGGHKLG